MLKIEQLCIYERNKFKFLMNLSFFYKKKNGHELFICLIFWNLFILWWPWREWPRLINHGPHLQANNLIIINFGAWYLCPNFFMIMFSISVHYILVFWFFFFYILNYIKNWDDFMSLRVDSTSACQVKSESQIGKL